MRSEGKTSEEIGESVVLGALPPQPPRLDWLHVRFRLDRVLVLVGRSRVGLLVGRDGITFEVGRRPRDGGGRVSTRSP